MGQEFLSEREGGDGGGGGVRGGGGEGGGGGGGGVVRRGRGGDRGGERGADGGGDGGRYRREGAGYSQGTYFLTLSLFENVKKIIVILLFLTSFRFVE